MQTIYSFIILEGYILREFLSSFGHEQNKAAMFIKCIISPELIKACLIQSLILIQYVKVLQY